MNSAADLRAAPSLGWYWAAAGVSLTVPICGVVHFAAGRPAASVTAIVFWGLFLLAGGFTLLSVLTDHRRPRPQLGTLLLTVAAGTLGLSGVIAVLYLVLLSEIGA